MRASTGLALLQGLASSAAALNVVQWDISKRHPSEVLADRMAAHQDAYLNRRDTISANLGNDLNLYALNVSVGTPPQQLALQLDTGSSDVWMIRQGISDCRGLRNVGCVGGTFNPDSSSTYRDTLPGRFNITYVDQTGARGDYFTDNLSISGVTLTNQTMGLALRTTVTQGIVGVGYDSNEAICRSAGCPDRYPSIIDQMVSQRKINTKAYSLWLNDLNATTGNILFGGLDTSKYTGQLTALPLLRTNGRNVTAFAVSWTGFTLTTPQGVQSNFVDSDFAMPAVLDSGTSTGVFPQALSDKLVQQFGAVYSRQVGQYLAPCYLRTANVTLDFRFGGPRGALLRVPASEFLVDASKSGPAPTFNDGTQACVLGWMPGGPDDDVLLGDTVLRSAYVVYDLDNDEVAIGQTNFNGGRSNVQEIQPGRTGIPDVSTTASQTVQASPTSAGYAGGGLLSSLLNPSATSSSNVGGGNGQPPLAQFTTAKYTGQGGYSTSQGSASIVKAPQLKREGLAIGVLMSIFAIIGSGVLLL